MNFDYPTRAKVALILLIVLTILSNIYFALGQKLFNITRVPSDDVTLYEKRFESLRRILPRRGLVGYVGERDVDFDDPSSLKAYYLTQYALSPLVVANTVVLPLVVGDFHEFDSNHSLPRGNGLVVITDFGNGVQLFRGGEHRRTWE